VETALLWWIYIGLALFVVGSLSRGLKYARTPEHLRWDLYPVAHEPRRDHGGSYLEEKDWWAKPRETSKIGEAVAMGEEIFLLRGVWVNNRKLWWGSMLFHWGLYLMILTTVGLVVGALFPSTWAWLGGIVGVLGAVSGALLAIGSLFLLIMRGTDPKLKPYTAPLDLLNLALLTALGVLSFLIAIGPTGMSAAMDAVSRLVRFQAPTVSGLLAAQMAVAALFLLYMPFTRMVHYFTKYFTYHKIRWDDRPVEKGTKLEERLLAALNFGVSWSGEHVGAGKTWAEIATTIPGREEEEGK
jgi:nitrate reductase gamma subunit